MSTRARNKFKEITKQSKCEYQCKKRRELVDSRNEPKLFWKNIMQCSRYMLHSKNTENISGKQWYDYFEKLLSSSVTCTESEENPLENIRQDNSDELLNQAITELEIRESVFALQSNKSPGSDGICSDLLKIIIDYTCFFLCCLFNEILKTR